MLGRHSTKLTNSVVFHLSRCSMSTINHSLFFSELSKLREQSPTRALMPFMKIPGMINLGTGLPNSQFFPFKEFSFTLDDGTVLKLSESELNEALQYSATPGLPKLLEGIKQIMDREHPVNYVDRDICVTTGSQDALTKAFEMLLNPGDILIVESPTYSGSLAFLKPYGVRFLPVAVDGEGLNPDALDKAINTLSVEDKKKCRVVYTIPTGQNPSGATASNARKEEVYKVCQKHNLLIMEDDPYWNLELNETAGRKSYATIDTDQRVLRFDSFSKILSSGLRLGWCSGPKQLINQLCLHTQVTNLHASGVSQMVVAKLLQHWGAAGWDTQVARAQSGYRERRQWMLEAIQAELGSTVEYTVPSAGMFVWMRIPGLAAAKPIIDAKAVDAKVLFLSEDGFLTPESKNMAPALKGAYVRASYSVASKEQMREAMKRFKTMLQ